MKMEHLAALFESVQVLPLRPTDVLVFRTSQPMSKTQEEDVMTYLQEKTGHENIVVLPRTADLSIIRPEEPRRWWQIWKSNSN